ncbi:unnamed protein product [Soboliphyme baturini]|uniref:Uncharacterized protein n=1 Tax=Soboliphyme baturini TaxID=241478 RepID=A0A183IRN0_9BILA|nr:unnamed protein product [Soboliphyme baturini]
MTPQRQTRKEVDDGYGVVTQICQIAITFRRRPSEVCRHIVCLISVGFPSQVAHFCSRQRNPEKRSDKHVSGQQVFGKVFSRASKCTSFQISKNRPQVTADNEHEPNPDLQAPALRRPMLVTSSHPAKQQLSPVLKVRHPIVILSPATYV